MIKNINKYTIGALLIALTFSSCESYLDRKLDTIVNKESIFSDFEHAQGFMEQCYGHVVNYGANIEWNAAGFLLGDETLPSKEEYKADWGWELGAYERHSWGNNYLNESNNNTNITADLAMDRAGVWQGWKAIRIANIVLETIADPTTKTSMTPQEKDLLKGQALFFRAFFHSEIMKFWGRIPYIDKVLAGANRDYALPRPATYKECAMRADQDYAAAAALLPEDWDQLQGKTGYENLKPTIFGNNRRRINKAIIYSFKGRNLLYAASPLMYCTDNNKGIDTYAYDKELAEMAAKDLAKVIDMDKRDVLQLGLASKDNLLYCFTTKPGEDNRFPATPEAIGTVVGTPQCEYIFSATAQVPWASSFISGGFMPYGSTNVMTPSHRFVHKVFGTKNGLACDEDPSHSFQSEFENRDPRFYYNLIIDGDLIIKKASALPKYKYAQCYTGGLLRGGAVSKYSSGYFIKKWAPITANGKQLGNNEVDGQNGIQCWLNMRLTDVYLMYAEALAASKGATFKPDYDGVTYSSLEVLNIFRGRFSMPNVETSFLGIGVDITSVANANRYMEALRRERSTEMCFEACRWDDTRRWMIAHLDDSKIKTAIEFERDTYDVTKSMRGQFTNINFKERVVINRVCEFPKHSWLPFNEREVKMFAGFDQNPGW